MNVHTLDCQHRLIASYCAATENEIAVDNIIFNAFGFSPQTIGHLPRPSKWIQYANKYPVCLYVFSFMAKKIWLWGGGSLFFIYQFFSVWLRAKAAIAHSLHDEIDARYVLAFTSRAGDILHPRHIQNLPYKWIIMPWAPLRKIPSNAIKINVFSLLSRMDMWNSLCLSVRSIYIIHKRQRVAPWLLQSYTAFRWFMVRLALDKLSGEFIMIEHYDRWAVLADSSVQSYKNHPKLFSPQHIKTLTLIQHGALSDITMGSDSIKSSIFKLRWKLRMVKKLFVYDLHSKEFFIKKILSSSCIAKGVEVNYYQPKIELNKNRLDNKLAVLFVGHTLCENLQQQIMLSLENHIRLKAYYKPHPISPMSSLMNHSKWEVILDNNNFPDVDLLISYPSTLVTEYAGHDIPSIIHPINLSSSDSINFIASIIERVSKLIQEKFPNDIPEKLI